MRRKPPLSRVVKTQQRNKYVLVPIARERTTAGWRKTVCRYTQAQRGTKDAVCTHCCHVQLCGFMHFILPTMHLQWYQAQAGAARRDFAAGGLRALERAKPPCSTSGAAMSHTDEA